MLAFLILEVLLILQLVVSAYTYDKIDKSTDFTGSEKADVSKNLTLGTTVLSASFFVFITIVYYFKFINYNRSEFLLSFAVMVIGALLLVSYHFLYLQEKSGPNYDTTKTAFDNAKIDVNKTEKTIQLGTGIGTLAAAGLIVMLLLGKYVLAEEKIVTVKQPVYMNSPGAKLDNTYNSEPDYLSEVSKNFIV